MGARIIPCNYKREFPLRANHDEQHFEPTGCSHGMRAIGGQRNDLSFSDRKVLIRDLNLRLSMKNNYQRIERRCVLA